MINLENISFDHCIKCTVCTAYCPVSRVTGRFPGPKLAGPDTERLRKKNPELLDKSLIYCSNCKRCEVACPSDVNIADIIQAARCSYLENSFRIRDFVMSRTDMVGGMTTCFSSLTNCLLKNRLIKKVLELFIGLTAKRELPDYNKRSFRQWYGTVKARQHRFKEKAVYFHGCYVNYNDQALGRDVIKLLNAMNRGVIITDEKCCGVPLIANGYLEKAKVNAKFNIDSLKSAADNNGMRILSTSSTCMFALKHEYPGVLGIDNTSISGRLDYIMSYINRLFEQDDIPVLEAMNITAVYHSPCHLERLGGVIDTIEALRRIPGLNLKNLHSECCGISGTYGFKKEYYQISQEIGRELFLAINKIKPDIVITDCETCRWQIEMNTPFETVHPVTLLARALKKV